MGQPLSHAAAALSAPESCLLFGYGRARGLARFASVLWSLARFAAQTGRGAVGIRPVAWRPIGCSFGGQGSLGRDGSFASVLLHASLLVLVSFQAAVVRKRSIAPAPEQAVLPRAAAPTFRTRSCVPQPSKHATPHALKRRHGDAADRLRPLSSS